MKRSQERKLEHMKAIDALKLGEVYEIGPFKPGPHYGEGYWESERMWLRQALTNRKYGKFRAELGPDYNGIVPPYQTAHYDIRYRKVGEEELIRDLEELSETGGFAQVRFKEGRQYVENKTKLLNSRKEEMTDKQYIKWCRKYTGGPTWSDPAEVEKGIEIRDQILNQ